MITYDLSIDNATWTTPEHCAPGTANLSAAIEDRWPILLNRQGAYGCYNRRPTAGGGKSIHGDGRAIDVGIGWTPTPEMEAALHECTEHLAANAKYLGVQRIIYDRRIWDRHGWRPFNDNAHQDHAHVEQTMEASWTNPLPVGQAFAVISPPPPPNTTPYPEDDMAEYIFRDTRYWDEFLVSADGAMPLSGRVRDALVAKGVPRIEEEHDQTLNEILRRLARDRASLTPAPQPV